MIPQAYGTEFYLSYMASVAIYTNLEPCFHSLGTEWQDVPAFG
jgi:hypothetical protein